MGKVGAIFSRSMYVLSVSTLFALVIVRVGHTHSRFAFLVLWCFAVASCSALYFFVWPRFLNAVSKRIRRADAAADGSYEKYVNLRINAILKSDARAIAIRLLDDGRFVSIERAISTDSRSASLPVPEDVADVYGTYGSMHDADAIYSIGWKYVKHDGAREAKGIVIGKGFNGSVIRATSDGKICTYPLHVFGYEADQPSDCSPSIYHFIIGWCFCKDHFDEVARIPGLAAEDEDL